MSWELLRLHAPALLIAVPLVASFAMPILGRTKLSRGIIALGAMALTSCIAIFLSYTVYTSGVLLYVFGAESPALSIPPDSGGIPIRIIFTIDALSAFMTLIVAIVGFSVFLYSMSSDQRHTGLEGYYTLFLMMIAGILGMVNTGDLFNFFVFLEISSLAGAGLVAFRIEKGKAVEGALKFAVLSTMGALLLLFAVGIFYWQYDALNIAAIASRMQFSLLDQIALVMLVAALAMKCGSVPLHFWTPDAYSMAPSSVTAMLVVSSQASLYGLFRVIFTLYGIKLDWVTVGWIVIALGMLSMFVGVTMAIPQKDVKRLMAYHAISQTGYMLLGVGVGIAVLGDPASLQSYGMAAIDGGLFHIFNHAMYKGLLFLTAGAIIYVTGTRDMNAMGGLGHRMKYTMIFFMIGALAIAGIPPFNGFASKLVIYESVYRFSPVLAIIAMLVSILTLASFVKVFHSVFMGPELPEYDTGREVPLPMLLGMGLLAGIVIVIGIFPAPFIDHLVAPAAQALVNQAGYISAVAGGG
ncbi:MAG: proton-conducting transporter membrane subunit [Methanomicrobiales archaeon]|nr:proton-conducting transporter membrane subunit [Methanomicrobiales archaeon]